MSVVRRNRFQNNPGTARLQAVKCKELHSSFGTDFPNLKSPIAPHSRPAGNVDTSSAISRAASPLPAAGGPKLDGYALQAFLMSTISCYFRACRTAPCINRRATVGGSDHLRYHRFFALQPMTNEFVVQFQVLGATTGPHPPDARLELKPKKKILASP